MELKLREFEKLDTKYNEMTAEVATTKAEIEACRKSIVEAEGRIIEKLTGTKQELETQAANFQLTTKQQEIKLQTVSYLQQITIANITVDD